MKRVIFILACIFLALPCGAEIITVDDDGPADFNNIQAAIDDANDGDIIEVKPGTYTGVGNRDISFDGRAIVVRSTDPNDPNIVAATIIDCNGSESDPHRGFYFHNNEDTNSVLAGLTITNGYAPPAQTGSNIYSVGGAIYCYVASPMVRNCTINRNEAGRVGGGIYCYNSNAIVTNCTITDNSSYDSGGGFYSHLGSPTISNCIITGNSANHVRSNGGGVVICGIAAIGHCTITGNWVNGSGGGIHGCNPTISPTISNCIVWDNGDSEVGGSATVSYSDVEGGYPGTGNIDADPLFVDSAGGDYHLSANSLCINAGDPAYSSEPGEADIDGDLRVINGRVDVGADEVNYEGPIIRISPTECEFYANESGTNPETQILSIRNGGIGTLNWEITEDCSWLEVTPTSGESVGDINEVSLSVDISELAQGSYNSELTINANGTFNSPRTLAVTIYVGGTLYVPSQYETIQAAINASGEGDQIIVSPGAYYENIDFGGKNITVRSTDPTNPSVVASTIIDANLYGSVVTFSGTETPACVLSGLTIKNGKNQLGAGICGGDWGTTGTLATIQYNIISGNRADTDWFPSNGWGGGLYNCDGAIQYNIISGNGVYCDEGVSYGGGLSGCDGIIQNNLISNNLASGFGVGYGGGLYECNGTIESNTIFGNSAHYGGGLSNCNSTIRNCIVWNNVAPTGPQVYTSTDPTYSCIQGWTGSLGGTGNTGADPCFADPANGDYHLQSQAGRWDPNSETWVTDANTSPCIDAGDPNSDWTAELWPHGKRINMGVYGGTPEASMSLSDAGDIADLNNNGSVDHTDLMMFTNQWLYQEILMSEDLDRNGFVDFSDFTIFGNNWQW